MWEERLKVYEDIIFRCPRFYKKGKTVPYTSANGHMFSILNKEGEIGIRFSKEVQKKYIESWKSGVFKSHGATMNGYVLITTSMLEDLDLVAKYLDESYDFVMSLETK